MRSGISIVEVTSSATRHSPLVRPLFGWALFANILFANVLFAGIVIPPASSRFASILVPRSGAPAPLTTLFASHRP